MPETTPRLLEEIELGFVWRGETPIQFIKLDIQIYLHKLSLLNTVSIPDIFGANRARSTAHNWVHKTDLQPKKGENPGHVAVDETVIRLNDEQYWLYAAVDPETNDLATQSLSPFKPTILLTRSSPNYVRNTTSPTPCFSSAAPHRFKTPALVTASITDAKSTVIGTASNVSSGNPITESPIF